MPKKGFELSLIDGSVDVAVVCHPPENPDIEHRKITEEVDRNLIGSSDRDCLAAARNIRTKFIIRPFGG